MIKKYAFLIALAISGSSFAALPVRPALANIAGWCEPDVCLRPAQAGNVLAEISGVDRQPRRVLEPIAAGTLTEQPE